MTVGPSNTGISLRVEGKVQRVGFRWWTQRVGGELGLCGWVRNLEDGAVEIHVRGNVETVREFERRLHLGPPGAQVEGVRVMGGGNAVPEDGFEIRGL